MRIELFDGEIETLSIFDPLTGEVLRKVPRYTIYPKSHYVTTRRTVLQAVDQIKAELRDRLEYLYAQNKLVEAQRLQQRTTYDLEMLAEVGYCNGIENYSRHLTGRMPGEPPPCLYDYLPPDALLVVDESHVTVPQIGAMYKGDRSRKETLVEFGFRMPSAMDNRPLKFEEWELRSPRSIYVSATPGPYELRESAGEVVELVVRPTGLIDPEVEIRPVATQVDDLLGEVNLRVAMGDRVLVTTLTKRMAENLTEYLGEHGCRVRYLHSDVDTVERVEIIRDLRLGGFDVLVGINLLREGLDMPEVSLVAILDADKEGFLRSGGSLIQTIGRAARNLRGKAILYADRMTRSMQMAIDETDRRRAQAGRIQRSNTASCRCRSPSRSSTSSKARAPSRARRRRTRQGARGRGGRGTGRLRRARRLADRRQAQDSSKTGCTSTPATWNSRTPRGCATRSASSRTPASPPERGSRLPPCIGTFHPAMALSARRGLG